MQVNSVTTFTGDDDRRVRATEVGVAGGATVGGAKYGVSTFKKMTNKNLVKMSTKATSDFKEVANAGKHVNSLWKRMFKNAGQYKDAIIKWAEKTATGEFAKKVIQSKTFGRFSGVIGGVGAAFVFISGIGEMGQTCNRIINNAQDAKNYLAYEA